MPQVNNADIFVSVTAVVTSLYVMLVRRYGARGRGARDAVGAPTAPAPAPEEQDGDATELEMEEGVTPKRVGAYSRRDYWDWRFEQEGAKEWLADYATLRPLLRPLLQPHHRILLLGCGNSSLGADLHADGFVEVVNTDFSEVVVARQRRRYAALRPPMRWEVKDMRRLDYPDASFDVVIDKAAMDAILADGGDVWEPPAALLAAAREVCAGVHRALRPGGLFVQVTFAQRHFRQPYLTQPGIEWDSIDVHHIDIGFGYLMFVLRKPA